MVLSRPCRDGALAALRLKLSEKEEQVQQDEQQEEDEQQDHQAGPEEQEEHEGTRTREGRNMDEEGAVG